MKSIIKNYSFNAATRVITLTDVATVRLDRLALITNVTTNKILYNFADTSVATATVSTNTITLSVLQGGDANTDKLRIDYDTDIGDAATGDSIEIVQGNISSGVADAGNPVKVGGRYNTTLPTLTNGQRGDAQVSAKGQLQMVIMDAAGNNRGANVTGGNAMLVYLDGGNTLGVKEQSSGATVSSVASSASNVTLVTSNTTVRRGLIIFNDSSAILYVKLGANATTSSYTMQIAPGSSWTLPHPCYGGIVDGIWTSANGSARITEITT